MKHKRIIIIWALLVLMVTVFVIMAYSNVTAQDPQEKKGEDSDPPDHGDWIIDSTGNYIGNYTVWTSGQTEHDDSIKVDGNIIIRDGGEITLFNTTINMTDRSNFHIIIEENGTLHMQNMSAILNGGGGYIGYFEIDGTLDAEEGSTFNRIRDIYINSTEASLSIKGNSFSLERSFHIMNRNFTFDSVSVFSDKGPAMDIYNSSVHMNRGFIFCTGNTSEAEAIHAEKSNLTVWKTYFRTSSNFATAIYLKECNASMGEISVGNLIKPTGTGIYAENSWLYLNDTHSLYSGVRAIDGRESTITMVGGRAGSPRKWYEDDKAMGGFHFENSDVLISNIIMNRTSTHGISIDSTYLKLYRSEFWNISRNLIDASHSTILVDNVTLSHVDGDAFHLFDVKGDIINCSFTADYYGYGNGTKGHGIFAVDSDINITSCDISVIGKDGVYLRDSTINMKWSKLRSIGRRASTDVHGIYMENSSGIIKNTGFNGAYGGAGFDVYAVDTVPFNVSSFIENNSFYDGRIYHQEFTIHIRVVNETGSPVKGAEVNLTDNNASNRKLSISGSDGWTTPFTVQSYEIFRHTGYNNQTNTTYENFTNSTYNDYHLIVTKEYKQYGYEISTEQYINISHTMELDVRLNVSTPDLRVKTAGSESTVLMGETLGINVVLQNLGEGEAHNVNVSYYYALNDTQDWKWFGSDIVDVPGIFNGGNHTEYYTTIEINAPIGRYNLLIVVDPNNEILERQENNNNFTIMDAFEVLTLPRVSIDHPGNGEMVNGTVTISGTAEDDYDNDIQAIELYIDGQQMTVSDITPTTGVVLWSFTWDTTLLSGDSEDRYPNGPHSISVRCRNSNLPGYDTSDWFNITVAVANIPELHFLSPAEGEVVNATNLPLYKVEVKVDRAHDLSSVVLFVDGDDGHSMTPYGNTYTYSLDTRLYPDGPHTLKYIGHYGYGNVSSTVHFLLNSPSEDSLPVLNASFELQDEGLTITGEARDDYEIQWVKIRLDDGPWKMVNHTGDNFSSFSYYWPRSALTPDTHIITIRAYDGFDTTERELVVQVNLLYDLTITGITLPEGKVTEDDWVNFTVVVKNTGYYASPEVSLILYIGTTMRTVEGISVPAHSQKSITVNWHARAGTYTISADINPSMKNDETDPTNNHFKDGNLTVEEKKTTANPESEDYGNMILIAAVVAIVLGGAGGVAFLMNRKKV